MNVPQGYCRRIFKIGEERGKKNSGNYRIIKKQRRRKQLHSKKKRLYLLCLFEEFSTRF